MSTVNDIEATCAIARALVERLLAREAWRRRNPAQSSPFAISATEVVKLLRGNSPDGDTREADQRVAAAEAAISTRLVDPAGRLARAARALEPLEVVLMSAAAAPDLDPGIERVYALCGTTSRASALISAS